MARTELHSNKLPNVQQRPDVADGTAYAGEIVIGEGIGSVDGTLLDDLAMNEEPVTIRLEPSADKNAASDYPIWVNGRGAEVLINNRWVEIIYLPVGQPLTIKRKYLGVIVSAKIDTCHTKVVDMDAERPNNVVKRFTTPVHSFSILEDANPRGAAWLIELRRRQL